MVIPEAGNLQRNGIATHKCSCNFLIKVDHQITLNSDLLISLLDALIAPILKLGPNYGIDQVAEVTFRKLFHCLSFWEVRQHLLIIAYLIPYQPTSECVVLGDKYEFDGVALQKLKRSKLEIRS